MECLLCLDEEPDDFASPGFTVVGGLWELPDVSELRLISEWPLLDAHSLSKILLDREGNKSPPLLFLVFFAFFFFSSLARHSSSILTVLSCFLRELQSSVIGMAQSASMFAVDLVLPFVVPFASDVSPTAAALTCSKKSTWTTTRRGSLSFWAACTQASVESFFTSNRLQSIFFSALAKFGCSYKY